MKKSKNLIGMKFGELTVTILDEQSSAKHKKWLCECSCGNQTSVFETNLKQGATTSCGCKSSRNNAYKLKEINTTHGLSRSKIYHVYHTIKNRCYKETSNIYDDYGGRGIFMCDEWLDNFKSFYDWAILDGYKEGLTIERIDVDKGYEPSNCKWIAQSEQPKNRRNTIFATINGVTRTLSEWSEVSGIKYDTIYKRKQVYGWDDNALLR